MEWLDEFKDYLLDQGYEQNTANKHFSTLKTILNDATDRGINLNMKYKTRKVRIGRVHTTKVFLDERELEILYKTPMPNSQKELARNLFIIASYTGVRYSDLWKITSDNFRSVDNVPYFRFNVFKTGEDIQIPAHDLVLEIMKQYDWNLPKISNQKYNDHLKEVTKLAGIDTPTIVISYPGGIRDERIKPKYALVSSHTARRNLVCNMYISGAQPETIKKISGHRSHDAFLAYLRLTPEDHLKVAYKSTFFKKKLEVLSEAKVVEGIG